MGIALDLVNRFYDVCLVRKDAQGIRPFLADGFVFVGPMARTEGADAFVALNAGFLPAMRGVQMMRQFERGDEVCSLYELELQTPAGETLVAPMADWVTVKDGKMLAQQIYYDARAFEKAFAPPA